jgi:hypothetical protein
VEANDKVSSIQAELHYTNRGQQHLLTVKGIFYWDNMNYFLPVGTATALAASTPSNVF